MGRVVREFLKICSKPRNLMTPRFRGMETQPALEGTDGVVELDAKTTVYPDLPFVVHPGDAKDDGPLRFDDAFVNIGLHEFRMPLGGRFQGFEDLFHRLMELRLVRIGLLGLGDNIFDD